MTQSITSRQSKPLARNGLVGGGLILLLLTTFGCVAFLKATGVPPWKIHTDEPAREIYGTAGFRPERPIAREIRSVYSDQTDENVAMVENGLADWQHGVELSIGKATMSIFSFVASVYGVSLPGGGGQSGSIWPQISS